MAIAFDISVGNVQQSLPISAQIAGKYYIAVQLLPVLGFVSKLDQFLYILAMQEVGAGKPRHMWALMTRVNALLFAIWWIIHRKKSITIWLRHSHYYNVPVRFSAALNQSIKRELLLTVLII